MKKNKKENQSKTFQIDERYRSELSFTVTQAEVASRQSAFWENSIKSCQDAICEILSIDTEKNTVDWSNALKDGKLEVSKKPEIKIEPVKENEQIAESTKSDQ